MRSADQGAKLSALTAKKKNIYEAVHVAKFANKE